MFFLCCSHNTRGGMFCFECSVLYFVKNHSFKFSHNFAHKFVWMNFFVTVSYVVRQCNSLEIYFGKLYRLFVNGDEFGILVF